MSPDPQEGGQALPRQADPTGAVELFRKPANRGAVPRGTLVDGIEQEVCVNEHWPLAGPSSVSIASPMLE